MRGSGAREKTLCGAPAPRPEASGAAAAGGLGLRRDRRENIGRSVENARPARRQVLQARTSGRSLPPSGRIFAPELWIFFAARNVWRAWGAGGDAISLCQREIASPLERSEPPRGKGGREGGEGGHNWKVMKNYVFSILFVKK